MTSYNMTFMDIALFEARKAAKDGEVPVGAVVVSDGQVIARAGNAIVKARDPAGHAELRAIRKAARVLDNERLYGCDLYVTLEPCTMCAGIISLSRIRRLYFGAHDEKGGAVENGARFFTLSTCHHAPEVYSGFQEEECAQILKEFFQQRRNG